MSERIYSRIRNWDFRDFFYVPISKQVLEAKPGHVKGLYRRGMAYIAGGEYEEARKDFNMVYYS